MHLASVVRARGLEDRAVAVPPGSLSCSMCVHPLGPHGVLLAGGLLTTEPPGKPLRERLKYIERFGNLLED